MEVELVPTMACELEKVSFRWNARSWKWNVENSRMKKPQLGRVAIHMKILGVKKNEDVGVLPMKLKEDTVRWLKPGNETPSLGHLESLESLFLPMKSKEYPVRCPKPGLRRKNETPSAQSLGHLDSLETLLRRCQTC